MDWQVGAKATTENLPGSPGETHNELESHFMVGDSPVT